LLRTGDRIAARPAGREEGVVKKTILALAALLAASAASAELTKYKDWDKSPEAYFLTPAERTAWAAVGTDEQAETFVNEYWAKRDPTPGTKDNEFKDQTGRLIAAADEQFKLRRYKRGAESVRGRLLVIFGPPTRQVRQDAAGGGSQGDIPDVDTRPGFGSGGGGAAQTLTWIWDKDRVQRWGLDSLSAKILVDTSRGSDELQTVAPVEKAIAEVAEKSIRNPAGTAAMAAAAPAAAAGAPAPSAPPAASSAPAPSAPAGSTSAPSAPAPSASSGAAPRPAAPVQAAPAAVAAAAAPVAMSAVAAVPAAVKTTLDSALSAAAPSGGSAMWGGNFRAASGEPFYAIQLYVPADKAAALTAAKFGGVVRNAAGDDVATFWEDAALLDMKTGAAADKAFEKSIVLPPGDYRGSFGLFADESGAPVASGSAAFKLEPAPAGLEVSPLILGNSLTPLTKRPSPTDPFVFGVEKPIRVDPKADGVFSQKDGLWYFYTIRNPRLPEAPAATAAPADPAAPAAAPAPDAAPSPRIQQRITVTRDGKPAFAPLSGTAELQPLGTGFYGSGSEIPLETFPPGHYSFAISVRDLNAPKDSADFKGIERVGEFVVLTPDGKVPPKTAAAAPAAKPTPKKG
jgi:GWxTD domain-containing protein